MTKKLVTSDECGTGPSKKHGHSLHDKEFIKEIAVKGPEHVSVDVRAVKAVCTSGKKEDVKHPENRLKVHRKHPDKEIGPTCGSSLDGKPCAFPNLPLVEYCEDDHIEGNVR